MTATISFGHTSMYVINEFHKFLKRPLSQTILLLLERKSFLKELYHFHSISNCIEWNMATDEHAEDITKVLRCLDNFVSQFRLDSRAAALEMLMFSKTKKPQDVSTQTDFDINCRDVESKKTWEIKHPSDSFNPIQLVVHSDGQEPTPDVLNEIKSRSTEEEIKSSNDCNICGKVFKCQSALTTHVRIHTGVKPFVCKTCGASFVQKQALICHTKTHNHKEHTCETCGLRFTLLRGLQDHLRFHTGDRPYVCDVCGQSYLRRTNLLDHQTVHSGEMRYKCSHCDKRFRKWCSKRKHERIHDGERPFSCSFCSKSFTQKYNLKVHMRTHQKSAESAHSRTELPST